MFVGHGVLASDRRGTNASTSASTTRKSVVCAVVLGVVCLKVVVISLAVVGPRWAASKVVASGEGGGRSPRFWPFGSGGKRASRTYVKGGGRDFVLNLSDGTISPKSRPEFALGVEPLRPLVLVGRDSSDRLVVDDLDKLRRGESVALASSSSSSSRRRVVVADRTGTEGVVGPWRYRSCRVVDDADDAFASYAARVSYVDDNFLRADGEDLVLDVAFGKTDEEGTPVNLVGGTSGGEDATLSRGGGRDWTLNDDDDGTISPRSNPDLVLGVGRPSVVLVGRGSKDQLVFDRLSSVRDDDGGGALTLSSPAGAGVGERPRSSRHGDDGRPKTFREWTYVESAIVPAENALVVEYVDDNFVKLQGRELVLDVSWWKYYPGNTVNFVGATADQTRTSDGGGGSGSSSSTLLRHDNNEEPTSND